MPSECMFECSSSACLPLGGVAAPVWCLCQGAGACAVSAASRWKSGCGTTGLRDSSGAGGCTRSSSSWTGRSRRPRRRPTSTPRPVMPQLVMPQLATRQPPARRLPASRLPAQIPPAPNPPAPHPPAPHPPTRGEASAGALRRLRREACRRPPTSFAATWHPGAGCYRVAESTAVARVCLRVSREALARFPYCIRV